MPLNKYALLRYRIIDRCLRNPGRPFPDKEALRQACEESLYGSEGSNISISTIEKDLWAMRYENELGYFAPIEFDKKERGYCYSDPNYTIAEVDLSEEDLEAIRFAALTLEEYRSIPIFSRFESSIKKLVDRLSAVRCNSPRMESFVYFERDILSAGYHHLSPLMQAIENRKKVEVVYRKFGASQAVSYFLNPLCLKEYRNMWYAVVMLEEKPHPVTFALDRMEKLTISDVGFEYPAHFSPELFFEYSVGISTSTQPPDRIVLRFEARWKDYLTSHPIHSSQAITDNQDGTFNVDLEAWISAELIGSILGYGADVRVEAPAALANRVKSELERCLRNY